MKVFVLRVLVALCLATLLLLGLDWIFSTNWGLGRWIVGRNALWDGMQSSVGVWTARAIGVGLVVLPVLTLFAWLLIGRDNSITVKGTDGDAISLAPGAVERAVSARVKKAVAEVVKVDTIARQGSGHRAHVTVNVAVTSDRPVPQVRADVRRVAVDVLKHLLGVADTSRVRVVVFDVEGRRLKGEGSRPQSHRPDTKTRKKLLATGKTE